MAEQIRGTVVAGEYGDTLVVGPADRQEDPSKWVIEKMGDAEVLQLTGLNADQRTVAEAHLGFPKGQRVTVQKFGAWPTYRRTTLKKHVMAWLEHVAAAGLTPPKKR